MGFKVAIELRNCHCILHLDNRIIKHHAHHKQHLLDNDEQRQSHCKQHPDTNHHRDGNHQDRVL